MLQTGLYESEKKGFGYGCLMVGIDNILLAKAGVIPTF